MIAEFAQIVGLLSAFSSGRKVNDALEMQQFLQWLTEHNHDEVRKIIEHNHKTSISVKALLSTGVSQIQEKLDQISVQIAALASHSQAFQELASAYAAETLSPQAIEILKVMDQSHSELFLVPKAMGPEPYTLLMSSGLNWQCTESRFLESDLDVLQSFGFLLMKVNSMGDEVFYLTRGASEFLKCIRS